MLAQQPEAAGHDAAAPVGADHQPGPERLAAPPPISATTPATRAGLVERARVTRAPSRTSTPAARARLRAARRRALRAAGRSPARPLAVVAGERGAVGGDERHAAQTGGARARARAAAAPSASSSRQASGETLSPQILSRGKRAASSSRTSRPCWRRKQGERRARRAAADDHDLVMALARCDFRRVRRPRDRDQPIGEGRAGSRRAGMPAAGEGVRAARGAEGAADGERGRRGR